jgi:plasmid replication initiation protein
MDGEGAARLLGISTRQVRRLAQELGGRRIKGAWTFDRHAISAAALRRNTDTGEPDA